ncbi:MAG: histidine phosphatase family protein [Verrucomicrobia bacterium]|nr:histidine phosphatase family protein [Verrucomicrobiota bacterium]
MTRFYLVRHGAHDLLGRTLVGKAQEAHLNPRGERQAQWLGERLSPLAIDSVLSSPLARCLETANGIAHRLNLPVETVEALNEVDFGAWNGRDFSELAPLPAWRSYNQLRSLAAPPGGESTLGVQARIVPLFGTLCERFPQGGVAIISHADVIKAALAYFLGVPIDLFHRIEIAPGSLSTVAIDASGPRVLLMNEILPA